jgi:hypothetical protein
MKFQIVHLVTISLSRILKPSLWYAVGKREVNKLTREVAIAGNKEAGCWGDRLKGFARRASLGPFHLLLEWIFFHGMHVIIPLQSVLQDCETVS